MKWGWKWATGDGAEGQEGPQRPLQGASLCPPVPQGPLGTLAARQQLSGQTRLERGEDLEPVEVRARSRREPQHPPTSCPQGM